MIPTMIAPSPRVRGAYLRNVYERGWLTAAVDRVLRVLEGELAGQFDTIAFSGHSGAAVAYPLAAMGHPITCVRKRGENSRHPAARLKPEEKPGPYMTPVEGVIDRNLRYVIVDEQVCSGATVQRIQQEIAAVEPTVRCAGLIVYQNAFLSNRWMYEAEGVRCFECLP